MEKIGRKRKDRKSRLTGNVLKERRKLTMILTLEMRKIVQHWQK